MTIIAECNNRRVGLRHITVDPLGRIYEVANLFDKFGNPTTDPVFASTCVVKIATDQWLPQDADDVPIYVVH